MSKTELKSLQNELKKIANPEKAKILQRFFKTGPGEYGEGDLFLGITVPGQRQIAKKHPLLELDDLVKLLKSKYHEERLIALLILGQKFEKSPAEEKKKIYEFYLNNTKFINNWDLVDLTAPKIIGAYLKDKNKAVLYKLARAKNIWERRIAIISTFYYIYQGDSSDTMKIAKILLTDQHDLIEKAVGWMLREVGKRCSEKILTNFLDENAIKMPRVMLRYAIEHLPQAKKEHYIKL